MIFATSAYFSVPIPLSIGFASYFIPLQISGAAGTEFNMWIGMLPLSLGMFGGSVVLVLPSNVLWVIAGNFAV